jgi:hypothetical protein
VDGQSTSVEVAQDAVPGSPAAGEPALHPSARGDRAAGSTALEPGKYDQVAKAASAGIMSHRQVESAVVEISGAPGSLAVQLRCTLLPQEDPTWAINHISQELLADVEKILGEAFVSHDLNFTVAERA